MAAQLGLAWCTRIVGWARQLRVLLRTAVNFPPPSWTLAGAQHMRMLEPMHARITQNAPIEPAHPAPKPIIEKRELPQVYAVHEKKEHANVRGACAVREKTELLHDRRRAHGCASMRICQCLSCSGGAPASPHVPRPMHVPQGLAHKTKHATTKHLALFASLGRSTLSLHISVAAWCRSCDALGVSIPEVF